MEKQLEVYQREIESWHGIKISLTKLKAIIERNDLDVGICDTMERDIIINSISKELLNMDFPCNGDTLEYKKTFYSKFKDAINDSDSYSFI